MTETLFAPGDQYTQPQEASMALTIFDNTYGVLAREAQKKDQESGTLPGQEFVRKRFDTAAEIIAPLDVPTSPKDIWTGFMTMVVDESKVAYADKPQYQSDRIERGGKLLETFLTRANGMITSGESDGLTVKTFFSILKRMPVPLRRSAYEALTDKADEPVPDQAARDRYAITAKSVIDKLDDTKEQDNGPIMHINARRVGATGESMTTRHYISPKLNGSPETVLRTWVETLDNLGIGKSVYYKFQYLLDKRYDTIVVYSGSQTTGAVERAVQEFSRNCPPELLSDTAMPSGKPVVKGVVRAAEPDALNKMRHYIDSRLGNISYNEFICAFTEVALSRASYDFAKQGVTPETVTPRLLSQAARPYFAQFMKLCGVDPDSMESMTN